MSRLYLNIEVSEACHLRVKDMSFLLKTACVLALKDISRCSEMLYSFKIEYLFFHSLCNNFLSITLFSFFLSYQNVLLLRKNNTKNKVFNDHTEWPWLQSHKVKSTNWHWVLLCQQWSRTQKTKVLFFLWVFNLIR